MPEVSKLNQRLAFSSIRKLTPIAVAAKKRGIKIYHLNIGQPDIVSPPVFLRKIKEFDQTTVAYEASDGSDAFKASLINYYQKLGLSVSDEEIVVTTGGSEALQMAFSILFNPGEECLTFEPTYTNYLTFATLAGVKLKPFTEEVGPKTKGLIITNPSNPTGQVYSQSQLKELVGFCLKHDLFIIADETYREFIYDNIQTSSLLSFKEAELSVVLTDSLSKRYSLCGARLGCLVSKNKAVMEMANKIAQARLASPSIEQFAASFLEQVPQSYFDTVRTEYQKRRDALVDGLKKIPGVKVSRPDGAFYLIAQLPVKNAEDFCRFLLEKFNDQNETVMLAPAEGFYITPGLGANEVRIAYVLNQEDLKRAVELIRLGLLQYQK